MYTRLILTVCALFCLAVGAQAQTSVALSPVPAQQFFSQAGVPLASGCVFTYITGTSTPLATYTDGTGTAQNTNPIILDGGGFGNIWLSNSSYRFQIFSTGGVNCASGVLQRTVDNVSAYTIINQSQNIFLAGAASDPGGSAGELAYRTDIPCLRFFSTFWDCVVRLTDIQTLTNKTLTSPIINTPTIATPTITSPTVNSVPIANSPGTYISVGNSAIGTVASRLTKLVGGLAQTSATTDVSGSMGITTQCVSSCGQPGSSIIQQSGTATCFFDNATTAGDYVQISVLTGGSCHDTGSSTLPTSGQVIGRALVTNVLSATPLSLDLYSPEIIGGQLGAATGCTTIGPVTVAGVNTLQTLLSCSITANTLAAGNLLRVDVTGVNATAAAQTISISTSLGGGTPCTTTSATTGAAVNQPWHAQASFAVLTAGAGGTGNWACEYFAGTNGGAVVGTVGAVGAPTIAVNTTLVNTLLIQVQMSVANAGNSVTAQLLKSVIY